MREGKGKMTWINGDYYQGWFQKGKANGSGIFQLSSGVRYQGQFSDDKIVLGKRISADNLQIYEGGFNKNVFEGYGTLKVVDEFEYRGLFHNNEMEGQGHIYYPDGS